MPSLLSPYGFALSWPILQRVRNTRYVRRALLVNAPIVRRVSLDAGSWVRWAFVFHSPDQAVTKLGSLVTRSLFIRTAWWPRLKYTGRAFALSSPRQSCHCVL